MTKRGYACKEKRMDCVYRKVITSSRWLEKNVLSATSEINVMIT